MDSDTVRLPWRQILIANVRVYVCVCASVCEGQSRKLCESVPRNERKFRLKRSPEQCAADLRQISERTYLSDTLLLADWRLRWGLLELLEAPGGTAALLLDALSGG